MVRENLRITEIVGQYAPRPYRINANSNRNHYSMACPLPGHEGDAQHQDGGGSFSVDQTDSLFKCFGCGRYGNAYQLQRILGGYEDAPQVQRPRPAAQPQKAGAPPTFEGVTIQQLAAARGLDVEHLKWQLFWEDVSYFRTPAIKIPYYDEAMRDPVIRYRVGLDRDPRFRWHKFAQGQQLRPYGLWTLGSIREKGYCFLVEGETDFADFNFYGQPVLGIPGASSYTPKWNQYFHGLDLFVWREPGAGGDTFVDKISEQLGKITIVSAEQKDPCEFIQSLGAQA